SAGIGVVSAVAIAVLGFAGPAQGASPLVDPAATGSITVHKFVQPASPTGLPANGTQVSTSGLTPIAGVGFQVRQVQGIDLTTNQGWTNASSLSASFSAANPETSITTAGYSLGSGTTKTTDASGVAAFTGLSVGLYLVKETSAPSGATPAQPVLVSVPITDPTNLNAWIYDVHIYPKNAITAGTMSVNDTGAVKLGDPVTWQVTADIPNVTTIDGYQVVDVLDTNLTYQSATVTLADGTVLNSGPADTTTTYDAPSRTLTVAFTAHGLGVLAAHPTTKVLVSIVTAANAVGTIANSALIYPNLASFNIASGQPGGPAATPSAETHWGSIVLHQKDTSG
ncbi:SpaH/EbpB family LPXTG-anchored major pilin, partial [Mesorhizobium japonicum]|uniref:SpaH/EbpB family LPXTG-anchored major pilin n=1 Tax=Mesorhizobium japonicum TaxID=2066070 RepID=UPI003B5B1EFF